MLSVLQAANDGSGLGFILIALIVATPLGGILFVLVATLMGSLGSSSSSSSSSSTSNDVGNSFDNWPYGSRSEEINAEFAAKQAAQQQRDNDWEERQAERDSGQYGIWRK